MTDARAKAAEALRPFSDLANRKPASPTDTGKYTLVLVSDCVAAAEALAALAAEAASVPADIPLTAAAKRIDIALGAMHDALCEGSRPVVSVVPSNREDLLRRLAAFSNTLANEEEDLIMEAIAALRQPPAEEVDAIETALDREEWFQAGSAHRKDLMTRAAAMLRRLAPLQPSKTEERGG
jgi:hypothetical protein